MASPKLWAAIGGIAVLAGVGYIVKAYGPFEDSLSGSVVPAERYRADIKPTILATPPPLGDQSVPQFMQTDLYQQLVSDTTVASALASDAFREAFADPSLRDAFANQSFRDALANEQFRALMADDALRGVVADAVRIKQTELSSSSIATQATRRTSNDAIRPRGREAMAHSVFRDAMANPIFREAMGNEAFRAAMDNDAFREAMGNEAFREAMGNQAFHDAMKHQAFRDALSSQAFRDALKYDAMRHSARKVDAAVSSADANAYKPGR